MLGLRFIWNDNVVVCLQTKNIFLAVRFTIERLTLFLIPNVYVTNLYKQGVLRIMYISTIRALSCVYFNHDNQLAHFAGIVVHISCGLCGRTTPSRARENLG